MRELTDTIQSMEIELLGSTTQTPAGLAKGANGGSGLLAIKKPNQRKSSRGLLIFFLFLLWPMLAGILLATNEPSCPGSTAVC